jgi:hypothetical protein
MVVRTSNYSGKFSNINKSFFLTSSKSDNYEFSSQSSDYNLYSDFKSVISRDSINAQKLFISNFKLTVLRVDSNLDLSKIIALGMASEAVEDYNSAYGYYQLAAGICLMQWRIIAQSECCIFFESNIYGLRRLEPFEGMVRISFKLHDYSKAFFWAETIQNLIISEKIACKDQKALQIVPQDIIEMEGFLKNGFVSIYKKMKDALDRNDRKYFLELTNDLDNLNNYNRKFQTQFLEKYSHYISQFLIEPIKPQDILLDSNEVLIKFLVTQQHIFVWLIQHNQIVRTKIINITQQELEEIIKLYLADDSNKYSQARGFNSHHSLEEELYDLLFNGLLISSDKIQKLIIIPDKLLNMPFQNLLTAQNEKFYFETNLKQKNVDVLVLENYLSATMFQIMREKIK